MTPRHHPLTALQGAILCVCLFSFIIVGCATSLPDDPFTGRYRFADPTERGRVVVTKADRGGWNVDMVEDGSPALSLAGNGKPAMVQAPESEIVGWFKAGSPVESTSCIASRVTASTGSYLSPFLCKVPLDSPFEVHSQMVPGRKFRSKTGYILIFGSPAGVATPDLIRQD